TGPGGGEPGQGEQGQLGGAVDVNDVGGDASSGGAADGGHGGGVNDDRDGQGDDRGAEGRGDDRADDHGDGLPRGHPHGLEDTKIVDALTGAHQQRVEDAQGGQHGDHQGQGADEGGVHELRDSSPGLGLEDAEARAERTAQAGCVGLRADAGPQPDVVLRGREGGRATEGPRGSENVWQIRVVDLADDAGPDQAAIDAEGHVVADGQSGVGEEGCVDVDLACPAAPAPAAHVPAEPCGVAGVGGDVQRDLQPGHTDAGRGEVEDAAAQADDAHVLACPGHSPQRAGDLLVLAAREGRPRPGGRYDLDCAL